jgi:hypothetical protein
VISELTPNIPRSNKPEFAPDLLHRQYMREDPAYRRRIREIIVLLALAGMCLGSALICGAAETDKSSSSLIDPSLALYLACCGTGLEWWATGIATMLTMRKFTETAQAFFLVCFTFASLLSVVFSVIIALRLTQLRV